MPDDSHHDEDDLVSVEDDSSGSDSGSRSCTSSVKAAVSGPMGRRQLADVGVGVPASRSLILSVEPAGPYYEQDKIGITLRKLFQSMLYLSPSLFYLQAVRRKWEDKISNDFLWQEAICELGKIDRLTFISWERKKKAEFLTNLELKMRLKSDEWKEGAEKVRDGKSSTSIELRLGTMGKFAALNTFIAAFALGSLGSGVPPGMERWKGDIYMFCISFASGVLSFNAVVGILCVIVVKRVVNWDRHIARCGGWPGDHKTVARILVTDRLVKPPWSPKVYKAYCEDRRAPMKMGMLLFPFAVFAYAVGIVFSATDNANVDVVFLVPIVLFFFVLPMVLYSMLMLTSFL